MITQERLKELFDYRPDGGFVEKTRGCAQHYVGKVNFGYLSKVNRYREMMVDREYYKFHRLVFIWHRGRISKQIDHIDRNSLNNRIENLREATCSLNQVNRVYKNKSGFRGVLKKSGCSFQASTKINKKLIYIGSFKTALEAAKAYDKKAKELFGNFALLNFP